MLDARKIGSYMAGLRREKDLTQLEVAERLNISHQAVSKWERGESLPDIGMLPAIARLFGVTVDELLGAGEVPYAAVAETGASAQADSPLSIMQTEPEEQTPDTEQLQTENTKPEPAAEQAAPSDANDGDRSDRGEAVRGTGHGGSGREIQWASIARLAPFLGQDTLDRLASAAEADSADWGVITSLAPFLSRDTLSRLVERAAAGEISPDRLIALAPFLGKDTLERLLLASDLSQLDADKLAAFAPFLDRNALDRLARALFRPPH